MQAPLFIRWSCVLLVVSLYGAPRAFADWFDPAWEYRMAFVADTSKVEGTFTDFPMLLSLNAAQHGPIFFRAKADGSDILVTASDGITVLPRQVVAFDPLAQTGEIWVRTGVLSDTDKLFYIYYSNPSAALDASPPDAWSDEYRVVYHFADDPGGGVLTDSSPRAVDIALDPAAGWTSGDVTAGQIDQGWSFNGTTHYLTSRDISTQDSSYVVSAWLELVGPNVDFAMQANPGFWHISAQINDVHNQPDYALSGLAIRFLPKPISYVGYHHFAWLFDAVNDTLVFFYDGEPQDVDLSFPSNPSSYYTGRLINPSASEPVGVLSPMFFNAEDIIEGSGDEFRLREGVGSAEWIATEYANQHAPQEFFYFGMEHQYGAVAVGEMEPPTVQLLAARPNPFRAATAIRFEMLEAAEVSLVIQDVTGREVTRLHDSLLPAGTHERRWDGRDHSGHTVASGVYFVRLEGPWKSTPSRKAVVLVR